jgi:hypothetical protein
MGVDYDFVEFNGINESLDRLKDTIIWASAMRPMTEELADIEFIQKRVGEIIDVFLRQNKEWSRAINKSEKRKDVIFKIGEILGNHIDQCEFGGKWDMRTGKEVCSA